MRDSYLITGGAGFIGTNVADHYLSAGKRVTIFDNFTRDGSRENVRWLLERHGDKLTIVEGDVRNSEAPLHHLAEAADVVFHFAAQVAVTTSVTDPREDFEVNALGTFNVLEAVRKSARKPVVLYSSTNKVYGEMVDLDVVERGGRYSYVDCEHGVPESRPLDFHSPYGCSKGCGDQYVIDYGRVYGLQTVVFRQSCIYGPHQFGMEDQGWVAWFAIRALQNKPVTIYGDGKQVRDVLFIGDLIEAYNAAVTHIDRTSGHAYNIGGGPANTMSLIELLSLLHKRFGRPLQHSFDDWRTGDQKVFIGDVRKAKAHFGWEPRTSASEGVDKLISWLKENERAVSAVLAPMAHLSAPPELVTR
jgi:CDP-paratose 2-epimerase